MFIDLDSNIQSALESKNENEQTPLDVAEENGNKEFVRLYGRTKENEQVAREEIQTEDLFIDDNYDEQGLIGKTSSEEDLLVEIVTLSAELAIKEEECSQLRNELNKYQQNFQLDVTEENGNEDSKKDVTRENEEVARKRNNQSSTNLLKKVVFATSCTALALSLYLNQWPIAVAAAVLYVIAAVATSPSSKLVVSDITSAKTDNTVSLLTFCKV